MLGLATVLMSFGFHYFEPANMSQLLSISESRELGRTQGRLQSWESAAGIVGAGLVLFMTLFLDYRAVFYTIGAVVAAVGIYLTFALPANRGRAARRRVTIKRKYWLYYTLAFLRGCRRHIFTTFAIFLLVKNQSLNITSVSIVMLSTTAVTVVTNRIMGRLSDRIGERAILASSSFILIFIFTGYAFVDYLPVLIAFFLIDNALFGSSIALKSYVTKIAEPEDLTSCLSFGMTANHIIAVIIPVVGGVLWSVFGYKATFVTGAVIVFIDLLFALRVPRNTAVKQN
jgi:predicted MFS family arabinose efflux permease